MDCTRDGKGGIEGMIHKEYGVGYDALDVTLAILAYDIGRFTESPHWKLGIVEAWDETYGVSLAIYMTMQ